eukprot:364839-Chlamydomonas_euryale.AAC.2
MRHTHPSGYTSMRCLMQPSIPHSAHGPAPALLLLVEQSRLAGAPAKLVARLAASPGSVAQRLLRLKAAFPGANAAAMINNRFSLLLDDDMDSVEDAGRRLRGMLPDLNVDKFVEVGARMVVL